MAWTERRGDRRTRLGDDGPELLPEVGWRGLLELGVDDLLEAAVEVDVLAAHDGVLAVVHPGAEEEDDEDRDRDVGRDEGGDVEGLVGLQEGAPSGKEDDDRRPEEDVVAEVGLEARNEGEDLLALDALQRHAAVEAGVHQGDAEPGRETADRGHVGEPSEDGVGTARDGHVGEEGEAEGEEDGDVGKAVVLGRAGEDARELAGDGERIHGAGRRVQVRGGCADGRGDQTGVDDRRETLDAGHADGNDEGAAVGLLALGEGRCVVRADEADGEAAEEVEDENLREVRE